LVGCLAWCAVANCDLASSCGYPHLVARSDPWRGVIWNYPLQTVANAVRSTVSMAGYAASGTARSRVRLSACASLASMVRSA
jgi:hypothetical protein